MNLPESITFTYSKKAKATLPSHPLVLRALGRAIGAQERYTLVTSETPVETVTGMANEYVITSNVYDETRNILFHNAVDRMLNLVYTGTEYVAVNAVPTALRRNRVMRTISTTVRTVTPDGGETRWRLSKASGPIRLGQIHGEIKRMMRTDSAYEWIHPMSIISKDGFIALLLAQKPITFTFGNKKEVQEAKELLAHWAAIEAPERLLIAE